MVSGKLPRPSKLVEQTIPFCKSFCGMLLSHDIIKFDLVRGLASFDSAVILDGSEEHYTFYLSSLFFVKGWITVSDIANAVSQYRPFGTKLHAMRVVDTADWFLFLASHYELQSRCKFHQLFRYASFSLPPQLSFPEPFVVPIPELESDIGIFQSYVHSLQMSYSAVPNGCSLYRDTRSVSRVFQLLGRGQDLIRDKNFSIWKFLKRSAYRRQSLLSQLESSHRVAVARPEALCLPTESDPDCRN